MPRRSEARSRTITTAARMFDRRGYHGTPLNELLAEAKAPRGSFYFHFPGGKEQLALEAVQASHRQVNELLDRTAARHAHAPPDIVRSLGRSLQAWLERAHFQEGCAVAAMTIEAPGVSEELVGACAKAYTDWNSRLTATFARTGLSRDVATRRASLVIAALEGAVLQSRALRDVRPLAGVVADLADLLEHEAPPGRPSGTAAKGRA